MIDDPFREIVLDVLGVGEEIQTDFGDIRPLPLERVPNAGAYRTVSSRSSSS